MFTYRLVEDLVWTDFTMPSNQHHQHDGLPSNSRMVAKVQVTKLARSGQYVPRTPIVGVECKLPRDVKDIQMRGGQAGDY